MDNSLEEVRVLTFLDQTRDPARTGLAKRIKVQVEYKFDTNKGRPQSSSDTHFLNPAVDAVEDADGHPALNHGTAPEDEVTYANEAAAWRILAKKFYDYGTDNDELNQE